MDALEWLFQQFPSYQLLGSKAYKPTLENTEQIVASLGNPEKSLRFIHVAGSNGKGSVCAYLASILKESGLKVGLFTSPHIAHFSERIRVNGHPISQKEIENFVADIRATPYSFSPSFFEITFGMALQHFKKNGCDICIIETGLGGRLDATNVILPELSVITSISLEHTQLLGDTLEAIATEKAGIIKKNIPVVLGRGCESNRSTFEEIAQQKNAPVISAVTLPKRLKSYFEVDYQIENFETVLAALTQFDPTIDEEIIEKGIQHLTVNTGFYGRMQIVSEHPRIYYDVSHNAAGMKATFEAILSQVTGELHVIYGSSNDKDLSSIKKVFPKDIHFYGTQFRNERSLKRTEIEAHFNEIGFKSATYYDESLMAMKAAQSRASTQDTLLVIGSFFLLSDFF